MNHKKLFPVLLLLLLISFYVPSGFCAGEFREFFSELLWGSGAIFGSIIICSICILISLKWRIASILFIIPLVMMGYYTAIYVFNGSTFNSTTIGLFTWNETFYFLTALFMFLRLIGIVDSD
jgi:hypothetical protein